MYCEEPLEGCQGLGRSYVKVCPRLLAPPEHQIDPSCISDTKQSLIALCDRRTKQLVSLGCHIESQAPPILPHAQHSLMGQGISGRVSICFQDPEKHVSLGT